MRERQLGLLPRLPAGLLEWHLVDFGVFSMENIGTALFFVKIASKGVEIEVQTRCVYLFDMTAVMTSL